MDHGNDLLAAGEEVIFGAHPAVRLSAVLVTVEAVEVCQWFHFGTLAASLHLTSILV
jgi:hypothetical protein